MTIPETMRAVSIDEPGGPEVLIPATEPDPEIGDNDVLVRVMAAGVNRPDVLQRQGLYYVWIFIFPGISLTLLSFLRSSSPTPPRPIPWATAWP